MKDFYCVATFHSTYHALNFEKVMKEYSIAVRLMPVPRKVSTSCGTAAEVPCEKREEILKICSLKEVEVAEFHKIENAKQKNWFLNFINKA